MINFFIQHWSELIAILSFIMSFSLTIKELYEAHMHLKIEEVHPSFSTSKCLFVMMTITNESSKRISIVNAKLDNITVYRAEHHYQTSTDPLLTINTSCFPISFEPHETGDILLEFVSNKNWNQKSKKTMKLKTSNRTKCKKINLASQTIPIQQQTKLLSAKHK